MGNKNKKKSQNQNQSARSMHAEQQSSQAGVQQNHRNTNGHVKKTVDFTGLSSHNGNGSYNKPSGSGLKKSPSMATLNRMERENIKIWRKPFTTIFYAVMEVLCLTYEFVVSLFHRKLVVFLLSVLSAASYYAYITPGEHQEYVQTVEQHILWWAWWVFLGVLSSVGFGSGLHTFLIYLGPHIAAVTLAAYECKSLDFPEPPYPETIECPDVKGTKMITIWQIMAKVRVESLLWGAGTALGELPPYFMARASRLGQIEPDPDDEEYQEYMELVKAQEMGKTDELSFLDRGKIWAEMFIKWAGFWGILVFASIPNPLFDLAGITCGHFLIPFWSFFGATLIGKALVKMHIQMWFVILAFNKHYLEWALDSIDAIPMIGHHLRQPIHELLEKQQKSLHRDATKHVETKTSALQMFLNFVVLSMIGYFLLSIINSFAQNYHKRLWNREKKMKAQGDVSRFLSPILQQVMK
ncbi:hypothetical protein WR25_08381 [Diploscapter pachys]|uniref:Vacuole membrane protein 1 n=1 Tax=Diploscapter pachys TaxID=2018661 RepID=A0A2A2JNM1_9BILA|nr:hypothetical protein WR25_08381 [Diploscapter pachys]